jgi:hypothetical protein
MQYPGDSPFLRYNVCLLQLQNLFIILVDTQKPFSLFPLTYLDPFSYIIIIISKLQKSRQFWDVLDGKQTEKLDICSRRECSGELALVKIEVSDGDFSCFKNAKPAVDFLFSIKEKKILKRIFAT